MLSSTFSSKPLALLLGLAIFAGSEFAVWMSRSVARFLLRHEPVAASGDTIGVSARIRLIEPGESPLLVLLGSSQVREGLDCEILTGSPGGGNCLNLGIGGGSPLDMLHISRELPGGRPLTLVVSIFPGALHKPPKSGFIDTQTIRAVAQSRTLSNLTAADVRLLGLGFLQSASPTLRHREGLRDGFREWARGDRPAPLRRTSDADRKPSRYFENRTGRIDPDTALSPYTAAQDLALSLLISREVARGNRVAVVDFPTRAGFETTLAPDVRSHYAQLLARLRATSDIRFLNASDLRPLVERDFLDFTHLDSNGRRLVSERLSRLLPP